MSADRTSPPDGAWARKPKAELRHWSTYDSAGEYWEDYRGYVPIQMMVAISRLMRLSDLTFAEAYERLLDAGAIVHVEDELERKNRGRA